MNKYPVQEMIDIAIIHLQFQQVCITGFRLHPETIGLIMNTPEDIYIFDYRNTYPIFLNNSVPVGELDYSGYLPAGSFKSIEGKGK